MSANNKDSKSLEERRKQVRPGGAQERRGYIRTEASVPIALYIQKGDNTEGIKTVTRNISATGMMIEIDQELKPGIEHRIDIEPSGALNPVHCTGKIIWCNPIGKNKKYHCGIEFTKIEEDNKNTFLKFLCDAIHKSGVK